MTDPLLPAPGYVFLRIRSNGTNVGTSVVAVMADGTERTVLNVSQLRLVADGEGALVRLEVIGPDLALDVPRELVVVVPCDDEQPRVRPEAR